MSTLSALTFGETKLRGGTTVGQDSGGQRGDDAAIDCETIDSLATDPSAEHGRIRITTPVNAIARRVTGPGRFSVVVLLLALFSVNRDSSAGDVYRGPASDVEAQILSTIKAIETKGLELALLELELVGKRNRTDRMLIKALNRVKQHSPGSAREAVFFLQSLTRHEEFRDLQWVLRKHTQPLTFTSLVTLGPPIGTALRSRTQLSEFDFGSYLAVIPEAKAVVTEDYIVPETEFSGGAGEATFQRTGDHRLPNALNRVFRFKGGWLVFSGAPNHLHITFLNPRERNGLVLHDSAETTLLGLLERPGTQKTDFAVAAAPEYGQYIVITSEGVFTVDVTVSPVRSSDYEVAAKVVKQHSGIQNAGFPLASELFDKSKIKVVYKNGVVMTLSLADWTIIHQTDPLNAEFTKAAISRDGKRVALIGFNHVAVVDEQSSISIVSNGVLTSSVSTSEPVDIFAQCQAVHAQRHFLGVTLADEGRTIGAVDSIGNLHVWNGSPLTYRRIRLYLGPARAIATFSDDRQLLTLGDDGVVCLFDPSDLSTSGCLPDESPARIIAMDPGGKWRAIEQGKSVRIESPIDGALICEVPPHKEIVPGMLQSVGVSKDLNRVSIAVPGGVCHWNCATATMKKVPVTVPSKDASDKSMRMEITPTHISPEGDYCLYANSGRLWIVNTTTGKPLHHIESSPEQYVWRSNTELAIPCSKFLSSPDLKDALWPKEFWEWYQTPSRHDPYGQDYAKGFRLYDIVTKSEKLFIHGVDWSGQYVRKNIAVSAGRPEQDKVDTYAVIFNMTQRSQHRVKLPDPKCQVIGMTRDEKYFIAISPNDGGVLYILSCDKGTIATEVHLQLPKPTIMGSRFDGRVVHCGELRFLLNE